MKSEFNHCSRSTCWINSLLRRDFVNVWPLRFKPETNKGFWIWSFRVIWFPKNKGTFVNRVPICEKHHRQLLGIMSETFGEDIRQEEASEAWLNRVNSQMLAHQTH